MNDSVRQEPQESSCGCCPPQDTIRNGKKIGRNEPCPCDSGKKYKKCCGKKS